MDLVSNRRIGRLLIAGAAVILVLAGAWILWAPPCQTILQHDTMWSAQAEPIVISRIIVVPSNMTLTISPGTTVYFRPRAGLSVAGRLFVLGTADLKAQLAHHPDSERLWAGISFVGAPLESRLEYVEIHGAGSEGSALRVQHSNVKIEHVRFSGAERSAIHATGSSLVLRQSVVESVGNHEAIRASHIPTDGHFLVEDNVFYGAGRDVVDIEHCRSRGAIPRFVGNLFLGGGEDGLDIDDCDAWVEGNIFQNFYAKQRGNESCAISCSVKSEVVVTNNLFINNDLAVMSKHGANVRLLNNTFIGSRVAAVCYDKLDRGAGGGDVANCVFWGNSASFLHDEGATQFTVTNSVLPEAARWPDSGNIASKPEFRDVSGEDLLLRRDSLLAGRGAAIPVHKSRIARERQ